jgi:hypothetical protein
MIILGISLHLRLSEVYLLERLSEIQLDIKEHHERGLNNEKISYNKWNYGCW